jgi:hypothetical protein
VFIDNGSALVRNWQVFGAADLLKKWTCTGVTSGALVLIAVRTPLKLNPHALRHPHKARNNLSVV